MYPGLYVLDLASGKVERKVDLRGTQTLHYEWSNDGQHFIVHRRDVPTRQESLQVYSATTGRLEAADQLDTASLQFQRLRDGRLGLVYAKRIEGKLREQVNQPSVLAVLDSTSLAVLSHRALDVPVYVADWAPDGTSVSIRSDTSPEAESRIPMDGSLPVLPNPFGYRSPDGMLYAVPIARDPQGRVEVRQVADDALVASLSLTLPYFGQVVYWSPDSRSLAVVSEDTLYLGPSHGSTPPQALVTGLPFMNALGGGVIASPEWSPDSKSIAYINAEGQLWQVDVASGRQQKVFAADLPLPTEPRWSPDGKKLAFCVGNSPGIFAVNADGSENRYIVIGGRPALSPDGRLLTFSYGGDYYVITERGTRIQSVTDYGMYSNALSSDNWTKYTCPGGPILPADGSVERPPSWAPDSSEVAVVDASANLIRRSVRQPATEAAVDETAFTQSWSPDGTRSAYIDFVSRDECYTVMLNEDGKEVGRYPGARYSWLGESALSVEFTNVDYSKPSSPFLSTVSVVEPDGRVLRRLEGAATVSPRLDVAMVGSDSNLLTDLVNVTTGEVIRRLETPTSGATFSPDGKYVALRFHILGTQLLEVAAGQTVRYIDNETNMWFSPDSKSLAYETFVCCESNFYVVDVQDRSAVPVHLQAPRGIAEAAWSPESTHLAYTFSPDERSSLKGLVIAERSTGKQVPIASNASSIQWFPDGKRLLYQGDVDR